MKNAEQLELIANVFPKDIAAEIRRALPEITEIRLRAERLIRLRLISGKEVDLRAIGQKEFQSIFLSLLENSLYAREAELKEGYFTTFGGCRVGVCGKWNRESGMINAGSLCIRVAKEIRGCAEALIPYLLKDTCRGMLILSRPGMGKTTILRDLARLASESGINTAIADERREIAACFDGIPQLDVGSRTDVLDGCPKSLAIPMLIRSCAPSIVFADEIGGEADADAVFEAQKCGVKVVASAHAGSIAEAACRNAVGGLLSGAVFRYVVQLGEKPGEIRSVLNMDSEMREYG